MHRGPEESPHFLTGLRAPGYGLRREGKMSRDPRQLRVFQISDERVFDVYVWTRGLPSDERLG